MKNCTRRVFLKSSRHKNGGEVVKIIRDERKHGLSIRGVDFAKGQDYSSIWHTPINNPIDIKPPNLPLPTDLPNTGEEFFRKLRKIVGIKYENS